MPQFGTDMTKLNALTTALIEARLAQAAQFDAVSRVHDARTLRLEALRDSVVPELANSPHLRELVEINIQDGETPRLWIDLISYVVMEPDPKSYRLVQSSERGRETIFETRDAEQMKRYVLRHLAHRAVVVERAIAGKPLASERPRRNYSLGELVYVWLTGIAFGALGLVAYAVATGTFKLSSP